MNDQISFRLDTFRAIAALSVFCSHFAQLGIAGGTHEDLWALGRFGVIGFFTMSGYVIAYVAEHKHPTLGDYLEARFARLYSVFLAALLITAVFDLAGQNMDPAVYGSSRTAVSLKILLYLPFFATFMFENSWFSLKWLSNGPMWSIAYEFWYYILFGILVYVPKPKKMPLLFCTLFIAGWKILLLAPIWLAGALIYRYQGFLKHFTSKSPNVIPWLSLGALALLLTDLAYTLMAPIRNFGMSVLPTGFHGYFLSDYIFTIPVIGLMVGIVCVPEHALPAACRNIISLLAGCSFSLYLFHVPLMLFLRSTKIYNPASTIESIAAALSVLLMCYILSIVTEHRKRFWKALIRDVFSIFRSSEEQTSHHV